MARKRKNTRREKNGRPQRQTAWGIQEPILRRRCLECGLPPTVENMRKVRGEAGGTYWGKLWLTNKITHRQYEAFKAFAKLRASYLESIDAPKEDPKIASYEIGGAGTRPENASLCAAIRARYRSVEVNLRKLPAPIARAAFTVVREIPTPDRHARSAGIALALLLISGMENAA